MQLHKNFAGLFLAALILCLMTPVKSGLAPSRTIAVVNSSKIDEYMLASRAISESLGEANETVSMQNHVFSGDSSDEAFWRELSETQPALVVTVGTLATKSALLHSGDLPVIYTMVLDHLGARERNGKKDLAGVTLNVPVEKQLEYLTRVLPDARRIGYIYSQASDFTYEAALEEAEKLGLRLVAEKVNTERDLPDAFRRMLPEIDTFWMPHDKLMYEYLAFSFIVTECFKNSVPIISVYRRFAEAGIPIAIGVDYEDIGHQTAELVLRRLGNGKFNRPVIDYPRKLLLFVNEGVASRLNIEIPDELKDFTIAVKSGS